MSLRDQRLNVGENRGAAECHRRDDHEVARLEAKIIEGKHLELDAFPVSISAQDEIERIEFGIAREDTRLAGQGVEYGAQALAGARLWDDAIGLFNPKKS